jgi:hypothetical protein
MRVWSIFALVIALMLLLSGCPSSQDCYSQPGGCPPSTDYPDHNHGPCMTVTECAGKL